MISTTDRAYESLVRLLQELVRIESTTGQEMEIATFIHEYLARLGFEPRLVPLEQGRHSVGVRVPGRQHGAVAFCGHIDTVDVRNQTWSYPPFEGVLEGNRMYGRGTADMKGGIAAMLGTAAWLAEQSAAPAKSVVFMFTADEERGYGGAISLVKAGFVDDVELLVIPEPTGCAVHVGQKGQLWVDVDFHGRAAHGALPEQGANAALAAAHFAVLAAEEYGQLEDKPGLGRSTVSVNEVHGGWQVNVIPETARVALDFRVVDTKDRSIALSMVGAIGDRVGQRWGVKVDHRVRQNRAPLVSDAAQPAVRAFIETARAMGLAGDDLRVVPYSTDAAAIVPLASVPLLVCGPGSIYNAHQPDEYIELSEVFDAYQLFVRYVSGLVEQ